MFLLHLSEIHSTSPEALQREKQLQPQYHSRLARYKMVETPSSSTKTMKAQEQSVLDELMSYREAGTAAWAQPSTNVTIQLMKL